MAEFAVGNGLATDMSNFDFSVLFFGTPVIATKKRYVLEFDTGEISDFRGTGFGYNRKGEPIRGDLEGFSFYSEGAQVLKIGGVDVAVKSFVSAAETISKADDLKIMSLMFAGKDIIVGGDLADGLMGFKGRDKIIGGDGGDVMMGGAGADTFVYLDRTDSDYDDPDSIMDFSRAQGDRIDLSAGSDIRFLANSVPFSGEFAEVGSYFQSGNTIVVVDVDADGVADMRIGLKGEITLTAADFIL